MPDSLDLFLDAADVEIDVEDLQLDREQLIVLAGLRRLVRQEGNRIVASLDNLTAAVAQIGSDVNTAATDVTTAIDALKAQIADLTAGQISQEQIDALTASVQQADAAVDSLDASVQPPAPEPAPEPAPGEPPTS